MVIKKIRLHQGYISNWYAISQYLNKKAICMVLNLFLDFFILLYEYFYFYIIIHQFVFFMCENIFS